MMRCLVFIAVSMDGFIARPNGALDWLDNPDTRIEGEDFGYHAFFSSVDALLMGRNTFETVLGFDVPWPYGDKPVYVISNTLESLPQHKPLPAAVQLLNGSLDQVLAQLADKGYHRVYVDGGRLIQSLLRIGRIDEMILSRAPVLIGKGIPLFGPLGEADVHWDHMQTVTYPNGFTKSHYVVKK